MVRLSGRRWKLKDRVTRAFYDYGKLCAAHPTGCLSISILTIIFLSYPAISKLGLPISSPMDVYWGPFSVDEANSSIPDWLRHRTPALYIQHFIVKGRVEPWYGNLSAVSAVKASLARSFDVLKILNETKSGSQLGLADLCFRAKMPDSRRHQNVLFLKKSCLLLTPTLFWQNNWTLFVKDSNPLHTIFRYACSPSMCPRDILFGSPTRLTGIKQHYRTNRHRYIEYAITLIQHEYNEEWRGEVAKKLGEKNGFQVMKSHAYDEDTFIHVFYRPRKYVSDYLPLLASYFLCALYFYYTVNKFQMVKSKPGLALAAFITVSTTLSTTAGICAHFELNASLWRASVFPYLAMIVGLENVLCITRSVVYTPPSLDVPSRLAHGLSMEGYSITKYFLLELLFLSVGYLTQVSQIQEFCTFAFIGIVVDLYMQLFFYAPCLAFDLFRMDGEDKQRFSLMLFDADIQQLKSYPNPRCPARYFMPSLFARKHRLVRTHSETGISKKDGSTTVTYKGHRRSSSTDKLAYDEMRSRSLVSNRLRLLYFWTKTRIVQRLIMVFFCLWAMWLAFVVHKWRVFEGIGGGMSNATTSRESPWISHYFLDTAPLEFGDWQRQTFRWWPALFAEYNLSLSGQYITFLPPIVLEGITSAGDPILEMAKRTEPNNENPLDVHLNDGQLEFGSGEDLTSPELKNRVYWLERQMTTMLVFSALVPFTIVVIFTLYTCFWDKLAGYREARRSAAMMRADKKRASTNKKGFVELAPLAFSRHEAPIECACVDTLNTIVSASVNGHLFIWDSKSGELRNSVQRSSNRSTHSQPLLSQQSRKRVDSSAQNFIPSEPSPNVGQVMDGVSQGVKETPNVRAPKSLIWCLAVKKNIIALGCSNGVIQLANSMSARLIGSFFESSTVGIVNIKIRSNRIIFVRLNGVLEIVEFKLNEGALGDQRAEFKRLSASRVHRKPVTKLICCTWKIITASYDHTLRIFDSRSMHISHTLNGHLAAVVSACVSEDETLLFSSCDSGRICCWSMKDGQLLRSADQSTKRFVELACTSTILIGFGGDAKLWLWDLKEGHTIAELSLQDQVQPLTLLLDIDDGIEQSLREARFLAVLSDQHIVTSDSDSVQLWDLQLKAIVKQVRLPGFVDSIQRLDDTSALCCSGSEMFRVSLPMPAGRQL